MNRSLARLEPTLAERLLSGDRRALARAITLVENGNAEGFQIVRDVYPHTGNAAVIGLTGPPGVGKSTLLGAITKLVRAEGRCVAVLSVDPSSPFTSGAFLGDRVRLSEHFLDDGVYIRSMANRGALGGLSEATLQAALLMDAAGSDLVLLETVGVGQTEVDIVDHADTVVLVLMPGSGDSVQALKAGLMEIPDVIVINKADHPMTNTMEREVKAVLALGRQDGWQVPVLLTQAATGDGVPDLLVQLAEHRAYTEADGTLSERRGRSLRNEVIAIISNRIRSRVEASIRDDARVAEILDKVTSRELDPRTAADVIVGRGDQLR